MPNVEQVRQVFKLAAREAKAKRAEGMSLKEQVQYILLVAGQQYRNRRQYDLAMCCHLARCVLASSETIKEGWESLQENGACAANSEPITPVSNTGVTETPAAVPIEYFTRRT